MLRRFAEDLYREAVSLPTPVRLRIWTVSIVAAALALLAAAGIGLTQLRGEVREISASSAPLAATASDLYFALSDLEAQVARLVMIDNASSLSDNQLDALLTYQRRSAEVDADIQQILNAAANDTDRATARRLLDEVALYRQLAWEALAVERQETPTEPGTLPPAALGYYTSATNVLHFSLLPTAKLLRESSRDALNRSYADQRSTATWGVALTVVLGLGLLVLLVFVQVRLTARTHRLVNAPLVLATLVTLGLVACASFVFLDETNRLSSARDNHFTPYLNLTQAQAVSYDAAADTSRYVLSGNLTYYDQDFTRKSDCLAKGGACGRDSDVLSGGLTTGSGLTDAQAKDLLGRWQAYQRDHERIVFLANSGESGPAIAKLTGIRRGDATFDFFYFDTAVTNLVAQRRAAFDGAMREAGDEVAVWPVLSVVLMAAVALLVPLGMRPRLSEYR
jgi:hypothetical protein